MKQEEKVSRKNLLGVVKNLLGIDSGDKTGVALPDSSEEELRESAGNLIAKATDGKLPETGEAPEAKPEKERGGNSPEKESGGNSPGKENGGDFSGKEESGEEEKKGCPYATKRAIVSSLREIRRFAEENNLGTAMVKTLLAFLAEMALDALKGKVTGKVLEAILRAFNYESAVKKAYKEGELNGHNAKIEVELFPDRESNIPDINGCIYKTSKASIFDIANGKDSQF